jgi:hypothetical protein
MKFGGPTVPNGTKNSGSRRTQRKEKQADAAAAKADTKDTKDNVFARVLGGMQDKSDAETTEIRSKMTHELVYDGEPDIAAYANADTLGPSAGP